MTIAASFFLVLAKTLSRGGNAAAVGASQIIWYLIAAWGYSWLLEILVRTFGLSKSGGFINLALEDKAKSGGLLDKVPFQWRSRVAQRWQICAEPQPSFRREGFVSKRDAESPHTAA
jgi:hypothetical protein